MYMNSLLLALVLSGQPAASPTVIDEPVFTETVYVTEDLPGRRQRMIQRRQARRAAHRAAHRRGHIRMHRRHGGPRNGQK